MENENVGCLHLLNKYYNIYPGHNTIGRNQRAIVNLKNINVSTQHAIITVVNQTTIYISDLGSGNGTKLNGENLLPLKLYKLDAEAQVSFADVCGTFRLGPSPQNDNNSQDFNDAFYKEATQILELSKRRSNVHNLSTQIVDIHEMATQISVESSHNTQDNNEALEFKPVEMFDSTRLPLLNTENCANSIQYLGSRGSNKDSDEESRESLDFVTMDKAVNTQKLEVESSIQIINRKTYDSDINETEANDSETDIEDQITTNRNLSTQEADESEHQIRPILIGNRGKLEDSDSEEKEANHDSDTDIDEESTKKVEEINTTLANAEEELVEIQNQKDHEINVLCTRKTENLDYNMLQMNPAINANELKICTSNNELTHNDKETNHDSETGVKAGRNKEEIQKISDTDKISEILEVKVNVEEDLKDEKNSLNDYKKIFCVDNSIKENRRRSRYVISDDSDTDMDEDEDKNLQEISEPEGNACKNTKDVCKDEKVNQVNAYMSKTEGFFHFNIDDSIGTNANQEHTKERFIVLTTDIHEEGPKTISEENGDIYAISTQEINIEVDQIPEKKVDDMYAASTQQMFDLFDHNTENVANDSNEDIYGGVATQKNDETSIQELPAIAQCSSSTIAQFKSPQGIKIRSPKKTSRAVKVCSDDEDFLPPTQTMENIYKDVQVTRSNKLEDEMEHLFAYQFVMGTQQLVNVLEEDEVIEDSLMGEKHEDILSSQAVASILSEGLNTSISPIKKVISTESDKFASDSIGNNNLESEITQINKCSNNRRNDAEVESSESKRGCRTPINEVENMARFTLINKMEFIDTSTPILRSKRTKNKNVEIKNPVQRSVDGEQSVVSQSSRRPRKEKTPSTSKIVTDENKINFKSKIGQSKITRRNKIIENDENEKVIDDNTEVVSNIGKRSSRRLKPVCAEDEVEDVRKSSQQSKQSFDGDENTRVGIRKSVRKQNYEAHESKIMEPRTSDRKTKLILRDENPESCQTNNDNSEDRDKIIKPIKAAQKTKEHCRGFVKLEKTNKITRNTRGTPSDGNSEKDMNRTEEVKVNIRDIAKITRQTKSVAVKECREESGDNLERPTRGSRSLKLRKENLYESPDSKDELKYSKRGSRKLKPTNCKNNSEVLEKSTSLNKALFEESSESSEDLGKSRRGSRKPKPNNSEENSDELLKSKRLSRKTKLETLISQSPKLRRLSANSRQQMTATLERSHRQLKPKVVFTMLDDPNLEAVISRLGGFTVDSVDECTVLVTDSVKRTSKLLCAIGQSKPICSRNWLDACKTSYEFLDPWNFIIEDKEAENKWNFSLKESLRRSGEKKLLKNQTFQIMVTQASDVLKGAIEACGGKCVTRNLPKEDTEHLYIVSTKENSSKYNKIKKQNSKIQVVLPEAIFDGTLRQEYRFKDFLL